MVRNPHVFSSLTWKCASRHSGLPFSHIPTSKSGPNLVCFADVDLKMRFVPQRRAIFEHRCILTLKCASCHSGVPFLDIVHFKSGPKLVCFVHFHLKCKFSFLISPGGSAPAALASLLFDPPDPQIIGKTQCFATFVTFRAPVSSFFWLFLFLSSTLLFYSSLLCFSSLHIVGSLTSKLPLTIPVVPHKAGAEVSRIGQIDCCESPMAEQKH